MTIRQICETSCAGAGIDLDETRLDELLKAFGIFEKKNQKIKNNVSFGEGKTVHIISRSKVFNDLIVEEIQKNPNLTIIMVSHCRAMNFTDQAMVYMTESKNIVFKPYQSYDCFSIGECGECY